MKITNSDQFSKALNFFCSDGFNALEKIDQKCFEKTLVASIESIKDSRLIIKKALKYQLGIDINDCRTWSEHPNCKKIGFVAFLFDEDKETILKMYFKMNCFGYISNDDMNIILTLLNNISEEILIKVISQSDHTEMFQIMSEINKRKANSDRKCKKDLDRYYNIFRKALVD